MGGVSATLGQGEEVFSGETLSETQSQGVKGSSVGEVSAIMGQGVDGASQGALSATQVLDGGGAGATVVRGEAAAGGGALSVPLPPNTRSSGRLQHERRKSVQEIITDFSSCMSSVSSGEDTIIETLSQRGKRKIKERQVLVPL